MQLRYKQVGLFHTKSHYLTTINSTILQKVPLTMRLLCGASTLDAIWRSTNRLQQSSNGATKLKRKRLVRHHHHYITNVIHSSGNYRGLQRLTHKKITIITDILQLITPKCTQRLECQRANVKIPTCPSPNWACSFQFIVNNLNVLILSLHNDRLMFRYVLLTIKIQKYCLYFEGQ